MKIETFRINAGNILSLPENIDEPGFFWFEDYKAICYRTKYGNSFIAVYCSGGKYIKHNEQSVPYKEHDEIIEKLNRHKEEINYSCEICGFKFDDGIPSFTNRLGMIVCRSCKKMHCDV